VTSLLVTNDFPPKVGGIQSYLHELWRRLPPDETTVLCTPYSGDRAFDAGERFRIERTATPVLLPTPGLADRIDALAREVRADVIFLDPALPLGALGRRLRAAPWVVITHGAEVTVPGRLPGSRALLGSVLRRAAGIVAAGHYPRREAWHAARGPLPTLVVPPGVDVERFRPAADARERADDRSRLGLDPDRPTIVGVSRLVPRKGFDVLIDAVAGLGADVQLVIAGGGRDRARLEARARRRGIAARTLLLGRVADEHLPRVYRSADVFAMLCRDRWGGLEAEGFGIVYLEAAASGVVAVAGRSGGSHEAVLDGVTGHVVDPRDTEGVRRHLARLLADGAARAEMGAAARAWAVSECAHDRRVEALAPLAAGDLSVLSTAGA
jgi:phosphatidylinositol alpha-1,6-mannosyltransferase